jgi:hypothetical protein
MLRRRGSCYSQGTDYANNSTRVNKGSKANLPGGGGDIPNDLNFEVFGEAIFEVSDDDEEIEKIKAIEDNSKASYNIYALQNKKLLF